MTVRQTANALGLKVRTIREWIKTGRLPAYKVGKYWMVSEQTVMSKEVQDRANKGREHSRRIKECKSMGVLAGRSEDPKEPI